VNRSHKDGEEGGEESKYSLDMPKREIEEYIKIIEKNTEFFSNENPDMIIEDLAGYFEEKGYKFELA